MSSFCSTSNNNPLFGGQSTLPKSSFVPNQSAVTPQLRYPITPTKDAGHKASVLDRGTGSWPPGRKHPLTEHILPDPSLASQSREPTFSEYNLMRSSHWDADNTISYNDRLVGTSATNNINLLFGEPVYQNTSMPAFHAPLSVNNPGNSQEYNAVARQQHMERYGLYPYENASIASLGNSYSLSSKEHSQPNHQQHYPSMFNNTRTLGDTMPNISY